MSCIRQSSFWARSHWFGAASASPCFSLRLATELAHCRSKNEAPALLDRGFIVQQEVTQQTARFLNRPSGPAFPFKVSFFENFPTRPGVNLAPAQILRMRALAGNRIDQGGLFSRGEKERIMATKKLSLLLVALLTCASQPALTQGGGAGGAGGGASSGAASSGTAPAARVVEQERQAQHPSQRVGASRSVYK